MEMEDEHLIELVMQHEVIYNNTCGKYRDASARIAAWDKIAKMHGKSAEECKDIWNKLRNCFINAMKRRKKKYKKVGVIMDPWRYEEKMSFLKPFLRYTNEKLNDSKNDSSEIIDNSSEESLDDKRHAKFNHQSSLDSVPSCSNTPNTSLKRKLSTSSNDWCDMVEMMRSFQQNTNVIQEMDDMDSFFLSMSKSVKKLPKIDQITIKTNLLKAVSDAELKQHTSTTRSMN
ncbi:hypothetical protein ACJJTC_007969 [Scirpophaga incertulas]